jgi:hypothetical protein
METIPNFVSLNVAFQEFGSHTYDRSSSGRTHGSNPRKSGVWPCRSSGGQSPASHFGGPGSSTCQVMWDLWWTKRHWDRFSPVKHPTDCTILIITRCSGIVGWVPLHSKRTTPDVWYLSCQTTETNRETHIREISRTDGGIKVA